METPPTPHTYVLSDIHLSDAEPHDPRRPLWKRFKRADLFVDPTFERLLQDIRARHAPGEVELVLNGDIFDFDSVMTLPPKGRFKTSWLERARGLAPESHKAVFKMEIILRDHARWVAALADFVRAGHAAVFVIGNHDLELHWPDVQATLRAALGLTEAEQARVRICEWFYISNGDTLITHGNQYDSYCLCQNPVNPTIRGAGEPRIRQPFGNIAGKLMLNGMGLFNPHVDGSFIKSIREYIDFYFRYVMRVQPLLMFSWLWTALATLVVSLREGFLPALTDPLTLEDRVAGIAERSRADPATVRALAALHVHPAIFNPLKILRELWLDRALLLLIIAWASFQVGTMLNLFADASLWWTGVVAAVLIPPFLFYARGVISDVVEVERTIRERLATAAHIAGVERVVMGHTHRELHGHADGVEYLNTGSWSPAFDDVECQIPSGRKCLAVLRPDESGARTATLCGWTEGRIQPIPALAEDEPLVREVPRPVGREALRPAR